MATRKTVTKTSKKTVSKTSKKATVNFKWDNTNKSNKKSKKHTMIFTAPILLHAKDLEAGGMIQILKSLPKWFIDTV